MRNFNQEVDQDRSHLIDQEQTSYIDFLHYEVDWEDIIHFHVEEGEGEESNLVNSIEGVIDFNNILGGHLEGSINKEDLILQSEMQAMRVTSEKAKRLIQEYIIDQEEPTIIKG